MVRFRSKPSLESQVPVPAFWVHQNHGADAKNLVEVLGGQDLIGSAVGDHGAFVQQDEAVSVSRGQVQVMYYAHRDHIGLRRESTDLFHEVDLMAHIEEGERLVEK